ncbi:MAG: phosphonopyruvate decarboxylase [Alphaproteobacteria bacterium]|nr:phosphonopyruvate decarboxylase [Alphaproteobacteria bacterium]
MDNAETAAESWSDPTYNELTRRGVRHVVYVPDAGLSRLIDRAVADDRVENVVLTTEQEGIGYLCGAWLGGDRGVLLMQSSGVGNCVNTLGLVQSGRFPFLALVTMRGEWAEFNPWQVPMGQATGRVLEAMGVIVQRADRPEEVAEIVAAAADHAFGGDQAVAVLLSQRLIGRKVWTQ